MPHSRTPPTTIEDILATADSDPEWATILEEQPIPPGAAYGTIGTLKKLSAGTLPRLQASLVANRPDDVAEVEVYVGVPATDLKPEAGRNRVLACYPRSTPSQAPRRERDEAKGAVIVLLHGGGHSLGSPESELPLARLLVQKFNAVVVLPSYRLAPEHPFPASFNDALETLKQIAMDSASLSHSPNDTQKPTSTRTNFLPSNLAGQINPKAGFILAGTSAGATISSSISHLYHKWRTSDPSPTAKSAPPVTGLMLCCGTCIHPYRVPSAYKSLYRSRAQNNEALPLDKDLSAMFESANRPDYNSPVWSSIDQQPHLDRGRVGEDHAWLKSNGVRVYFQVCGQDLSRDDGLIYEKVLREECGVQTRLDLYKGFGHVFWGMGGGYADMSMSRKRTEHSVEGVRWLLGRNEGIGGVN
ncbi:hypothetical protein LTR70_006174 [Exophiala xenobiotica]|nr:hypothetical protein LTR70_006174 [Exophiala xenobiotica]